MQRTLNRELKELEVVGREAIVISNEGSPGAGFSERGYSICEWQEILVTHVSPSILKMVYLTGIS